MRNEIRFRLRVLYTPVLVLGLSSCGGQGLGETLGYTRTAPDEFSVVSRPSLSVPPEFTLRPPRPGEPPRAPSAEETAKSLLTGREATVPKSLDDPQPTAETAVTPVLSENTPSPAGSQFLKRAGAGQANDTIRTLLSEDAARPADTSNAKTLVEKLQGKDKSEPTVDAKKEAERLRQNKDEGKPVTEGTVPEEKPTTPTLIDRIF